MDKDKNFDSTALYHRQHNYEPIIKASSSERDLSSSGPSEEELTVKAKELAQNLKILLQKDIDREKKRASNYESDDEYDEEDEDDFVSETKSPVHILLYGRTNHKTESYSVVNERQQHHVRVDLTIIVTKR